MLRSPRTKALAVILVLVGTGVLVGVLVAMRRTPTSAATGGAGDDEPGRDPSPRANRLLPALAVDPAMPGPDAAVSDGGRGAVVAPTHVAGPKCESCSAQNCAPATSGCDQIESAGDRKLCEELYACFTDPANDCVTQGDAVKCWCGTNPTTCLSANSGPTRANGPCVDKVFAGARSTDPATIRERFLDPAFPLGRAVSLTGCRGAFCSSECVVQ